MSKVNIRRMNVEQRNICQMNVKPNIRRMNVEDTLQVYNIEKTIFSLPWSQKSFLEACQKLENIYLTAIIDGQVVGYCGMWTVMEEGNITNMAVAEQYRKNGIAFLLMKEMEQIAIKKGITAFFLEVRESNINAIKLYEKMKYKSVGIRKNFYERPVENAIVMSKIIG